MVGPTHVLGGSYYMIPLLKWNQHTCEWLWNQHAFMVAVVACPIQRVILASWLPKIWKRWNSEIILPFLLLFFIYLYSSLISQLCILLLSYPHIISPISLILSFLFLRPSPSSTFYQWSRHPPNPMPTTPQPDNSNWRQVVINGQWTVHR
jgi:hypothetical protein